jgi:hypothetical protein
LISKIAAYTLLLVVLAEVVWRFSVLWELAVAAAIGGIYWTFFRIPPNGN